MSSSAKFVLLLARVFRLGTLDKFEVRKLGINLKVPKTLLK